MTTNGAKVLRADHIGSLMRPADLVEAMQSYENGGSSLESLRTLQDRHIRDAVKLQESAGMASITDGEFRRRGWSRGFMDAVGGFTTKPGKMMFRSADGKTTNPMPAAYVATKLKRSKPIVVDDFNFLRKVTTCRPKVTMPTPSVFHIGLFENSVDRAVYPTIEEFFGDLVAIYREEIKELGAVGCEFLQLDETQLAVLCDPANREIARQNKQDPDKLMSFYIEVNNRIVAGRPESMTIGIHLCRGNQSGLFMADGGYEPVAERLFNQLDSKFYFLEYDSARAGDFSPLRFVPKGKIVVLGLISTKTSELEKRDDIRRRVGEAAKYVPLDQLALSPQCGFASSISTWNVTKNPMTPEAQKRKLELVVETAATIWS